MKKVLLLISFLFIAFLLKAQGTIFQRVDITSSSDSIFVSWRFDTRIVKYFEVEISHDGMTFKKISGDTPFFQDQMEYATSIPLTKEIFSYYPLLLMLFPVKSTRLKSKFFFIIALIISFFFISCAKEKIQEIDWKDSIPKKSFMRVRGVVGNGNSIYSPIRAINLHPEN